MSSRLSLPGGTLGTRSSDLRRRCVLSLVILAVMISFIGLPVQATGTGSDGVASASTASVGENVSVAANESETDETAEGDTETAYATEGNADIFGVPTAKYKPEAIDTTEDDRGREVSTYGPTSDSTPVVVQPITLQEVVDSESENEQ